MFDISLGRATSRRCDGATRRDFLRVGGLGALALPTLLAMESRAKAGVTKRPGAKAKSVILVYLGGGLSHHDTFDMKPDAPVEVRGNYKPIPSSVPGLQVGEKLPMLAKVMDKLALVRSCSHNNDHHETATNWVLSGRFGSPFGDYPAIGAVAAHDFGFTTTLPPYVAVPGNPSFTWELGKSAFLGGRYESFKAGDPSKPDYKVENLTQTAAAERVQRRGTLLSAVDGLAKSIEGNDQIATYDEFQQRAAAMILSSETRQAFAVGAESDKLRDRYGRTTFGQSALLARRLVEAGVRFVTVNFGGWDHHGKIFESLDKKLPDFDRGLSALVSDLSERGSDKETLVVVMGEFGRSPKVNKDAGRDHWGQAASMLFFGAGVKPGFVLGKTDKVGGYPTQRPVAPADVCYTILDALGVNPRKQVQTPDGRPIEVLDNGEAIHELFS